MADSYQLGAGVIMVVAALLLAAVYVGRERYFAYPVSSIALTVVWKLAGGWGLVWSVMVMSAVAAVWLTALAVCHRVGGPIVLVEPRDPARSLLVGLAAFAIAVVVGTVLAVAMG